MSTGKYWRDASTIILAAKSDKDRHHGNANYDYEVLLLQRSGSMKFHSEVYVYPGGVISSQDADARWSDLFTKYGGKSIGDISSALGNPTKRPPILMDDAIEANVIPKSIAMRITAIRETFEESGILLLVDKSTADPRMQSEFKMAKSDLDRWRKAVNSDPTQFLAMCEAVGAVPNVWALADWNNWLTPVMKKVTEAPKKARRYDTMFFLCCLNYMPTVQVDGTELVDAVWDSPAGLIYKRSKGQISCGVPQRYETLRLCHIKSLQQLCEFSHQRAALGVQRTLVVIILCSDGTIAIYPGDDLYPKTPDPEGFHGVLSLEKGVKELRESSTHLNRIENMHSEQDAVLLCNLSRAQLLGHYQPADEAAILDMVRSNMANL